MAAADRKTCPMCGEEIAAAARICRYCGEELDAEPSAAEQERIRREAERIVQEGKDKETALQIFLTSLVGCISPVVAIYGTIFLLLRPYSFPRKSLAVFGTVLHWIWTAVLATLILINWLSNSGGL